MIKFNLFC